MLNDSLSKEWSLIFITTDLIGQGTINNFTNYKEIIIVISASAFHQTHYVPISILVDSLTPFVSSWYYQAGSNAMATIGLTKNGSYQIGQGVAQNTTGSSIAIYAR